MHTPDHPAHALMRLTTLRSLQIVDTLPENDFDCITQRLFGYSAA